MQALQAQGLSQPETALFRIAAAMFVA